jgi:hypothetical protein
MVMTYCPRPAMFGPLPAMARFCALRPRFTVTGAACAIKAVNSNPSKQKVICEMDFLREPIGRKTRFPLTIVAFIDISFTCKLRQVLESIIPLKIVSKR